MAIDLSQLPAPNVVEVLSFEAIFDAMKAELIGLDPSLAPALALESEPLVKLLQVAAYRETVIRNRVNQASRAVMIAYAQGADLDQLAAIMGVTRLVLDPGDPLEGIAPTLESDDDLRRRVVLAPEGFSVAGPEGAYVFHALSGDPEVLDASATSPAPGEVVVTVLSREGAGEASPALLAKVEAAVSADDTRPLTDQVSVESAVVVPYEVSATLYTYAGPDSSVVLVEARRRVEEFAAVNHRLGRDVTLSGLYAALHVAGVQRVHLTYPTADTVVDRTMATWCSGITITHGGTGE